MTAGFNIRRPGQPLDLASAEVMKPTMDEHGNWTTAPATSIDGNDKRVIRASLRAAVAVGLNLDLNDHPERDHDQV